MNGLFYVGPKGGEVHFLKDGEIVRSIPLPAGAYATASFQKLRRRGEDVGFPAPVALFAAQSVRIQHPGHAESAANPSFRVSPAQRQAKQLQALMARSEALNRSAQKALQAAKRAAKAVPQIEHRPEAPVSGAGEIPAS